MEPFTRASTAASVAAMASGVPPGSGSSARVLLKQTEWERRMETADRQQAEIAMLQAGLVRDQLGTLAREMVNMRGDLEAVRSDVDRKFNSARDLINDERAAREANHAAALGAVESAELRMKQDISRLREDVAASEARLQQAVQALRAERQQAVEELATELRASVASNLAGIKDLEAKNEAAVSAMARLDAQREAGDAELREQMALSHDRVREQLLNLSEAVDRERSDRFQQDTAMGQRVDRETRGIWEAVEQIRMQITPKIVEYRAVSPKRVMAPMTTMSPMECPSGSVRVSPLTSCAVSSAPPTLTAVASPATRSVLVAPPVSTMVRSPSNSAINVPASAWRVEPTQQ